MSEAKIIRHRALGYLLAEASVATPKFDRLLLLGLLPFATKLTMLSSPTTVAVALRPWQYQVIEAVTMTSRDPELSDIQALEEALHRPEVRRSRDALEALLAVSFVEFGASGTVYDRATIIELLLHEDAGGDDGLRTSDYALTAISDDAVLLTYQSERTQDDDSSRSVLRSSIWKRAGDGWQMLFHQGTIKRGFRP